jgi:pimeloyl-ACP methyl ester carboxylesterase
MQLPSVFGSAGFAAMVAMVAMVVIAACGDNQGAQARGPRDTAAVSVPTSAVVDLGVRREVYRIPGAVAPPNPVTGVTTPAAYNQAQIARYRRDATPPAPARAVIILMPGILGGAGSFDVLARLLVRAAVAVGETLEVWAIDRRSNLQEDTIGFDTAEALGDPEIAQGYYFGVDTISGKPFPGALDPDAASYMSEWGLAVHVEDLRKVIEQISPADRRGHVFLCGHSLGAGLSEAYAAWSFGDGVRGFEQLAGLVLIDGVLGSTPSTEAQWRGGQSGGLFVNPGVDKQRSVGPRYVELPVFGPLVFARAEVLSARVLQDPQGVVDDPGRDDGLEFQLLFQGDQLPKMTNAAALGWAFDNNSNPLAFTAASLGQPGAGAIESYNNPLVMRQLVRPQPGDTVLTWSNASATDPDDFTPLENFARTFVDGPTNFAEWYFPLRLVSDLSAVGGARVAAGSYQMANGLSASAGAAIDAPVLAISAGLTTASSYEALRTRLTSPVGAGRPRSGATRAQREGFEVIAAAGFSHLDPLTASDRPDNPVPGAILTFILANAAPGLISVPAAQ